MFTLIASNPAEEEDDKENADMEAWPQTGVFVGICLMYSQGAPCCEVVLACKLDRFPD